MNCGSLRLPLARPRLFNTWMIAAVSFAIQVAHAGVAVAGRAENCPLVYDRLGLAVAMSEVQEKAFRRSLALAQSKAGSDEIKRLMILREAMLEIASVPPSLPASGDARVRTGKTWTAPAQTLEARPLTANELYAAIRKRVDLSIPSRSSALAGYGRTDATLAPATAVDLKKVEFADAAEKLGSIAMVPMMEEGRFDLIRVFKSAVAITTPSFDTTRVDRESDLGRLGICSGTRVGKTAVLTAAHCVCMLGLNNEGNVGASARKIRVGSKIQVNSGGDPKQFTHFFEANIVPSKTRCFDGGSCGNICSGEMTNTRLAGKDVAIVFADAFAPTTSTSGPWSDWDEVSDIADNAKFNEVVGGSTGPGNGRLFAVGFGYDPSTNTDYGLGVKRCGQLIVERPCSLLGLPCRNDAELLLTADVAGDVHQDTDACPGDSGAPAFLMDTDSNGATKFLVAGLVSRGPQLAGPFWSQCSARGSLYEFASNPGIAQWIKDTVTSGD